MAKTGGEKKNKKKKKSKRSGPDAVAMKMKVRPTPTPRENPFETIWSRKKFDILGKKHKGEERRIGLARSRAIDKRKKTLLLEYQKSGKASVFVDKRIGENNDELGEFDKAILRSQRHHQLKIGKKSKYKLSDEEEEEEDDFGFMSLGHLPERDDFEDEVPLEDEGEESGKNSTILKHLGSYGTPNAEDGGAVGGEENINRTKKEVMEEIIMKSKFFKAQKAKDKEENEQLMEKLDKNFTSLVESRVLLSMTEPGKINALKALANKAIPKEQLKKDEVLLHGSVPVLDQDKPDSYDKLVKEMALDMRARPSDRTKTPEEIAQEERERLEKLEEERRKRMVAADDSSEEENDNIAKLPTNQPRSVSGDDLGDSFSFDEEPLKKKGWVDEILERRNAQDLGDEEDDTSDESESGDDGGEDEKSDKDSSDEDTVARDPNLSLKDWEQSDDDDVGTDLEEEADNAHDDEDDDDKKEIEMKACASSNLKDTIQTQQLDTEHLDAKKIKSKSEKHSAQSDLPFVIEAPKSFEELCTLVENCSNTDVILVINRIRACNAIKLAAENRKKMQVFYGILLQYFAVLANKKPLNFELLNLLVKPLMEMSVEIPYFSAICARQRISRTRAQFCEAIKNPENGCWPSFKTLSLLRLWSMIFPCSDFRHAVMTPAMLLMCEYLMRCPILAARDVAIGSFLCSMILAVCKQSHKFCPEAIIFLQTLLVAATDKKPSYFPESRFCHLVELKAISSMVCIQNHVNEISPLNFALVIGMPDDSPFFKSDNFRASLLLTVVETFRGFVETYKGLNSFPEVFQPTTCLLVEVAEQDTMPAILQVKFKEVAQLIEEKVNEHYMLRQPLQMRKQKPVPIKLLNPKFEENFVKGRDYNPDREQVERKKLKKLLKREAKGAARELRKDNYFLLEAKNKDRAHLEEEEAEKYGKARAFLQEQEHAFKSGQLGKGRKRRR